MKTFYKNFLALCFIATLTGLFQLHADVPIISLIHGVTFFAATPCEKISAYGKNQLLETLANKLTTTVEQWYEHNCQNNPVLNGLVDTLIYYCKHDASLKQAHPNKPPMVIFDVDETALSNYKIFCNKIIAKTLIGGATQAINNADPKDIILIQPIWRLYQFFKQNHYKIVFLTARYDTDTNRNMVKQQLISNGFNIFEHLFMRSPAWKKSIATFKESIRTHLAEKFNIVATIDDDWRNLQGKNVGKYALWVPSLLEHKPGEDTFYKQLLNTRKNITHVCTKNAWRTV